MEGVGWGDREGRQRVCAREMGDCAWEPAQLCVVAEEVCSIDREYAGGIEGVGGGRVWLEWRPMECGRVMEEIAQETEGVCGENEGVCRVTGGVCRGDRDCLGEIQMKWGERVVVGGEWRGEG